MKCRYFNNIFCHFEFVVCFAPFLHQDERNIILELGSTAYSVKWKRGSGDTPTRRVQLCEVSHGSVVGAEKFHDLGTLTVTMKLTLGPKLIGNLFKF